MQRPPMPSPTPEEVLRLKRVHNPIKPTELLAKGLLLLLGAFIFAVGLEAFLVPNQIIDGGIVGVSIITSYLTDTKLAIWLVLFNIPFIFFGYRQIGKTFAVVTLLAITLMSGFTILLHSVEPFTDDLLLSTVFGGFLLGAGVGLVIRAGGSLDGTEILAVSFTDRLPFSVGEIVMFFNIFILGMAGFIFSWDRAMYSLLTYFIAFKTIDIVLEGIDQSKAAWIITTSPDDVGQAIMDRLGRGVTYLHGEGAYTGDGKKVVFTVISRLEETKLKDILDDYDEKAFLAIGNIHDVRGGQFKKKNIH
ncbi:MULTISPECIES: YitT family protein [Exiguobacterium]|uniref:YitT family protein n=1 Tax=Exiguobacterium mexicanum TaxID=340146 RepID=A0ABT7MN19_9BACL|nr:MULTISPECIES: YitT family protein [Exiguobacterium]MDL5376592.1 YitT family protein [Exiguobacterium mexicanum]